MNPLSEARLHKAAKICESVMLAVGALMILYVGIAVFGWVSSSARHYAAFVAFVMNYIGLGVTQGLFLYAQTAADDIFFLVIYATTLFGLGVMPMIVEAGRLVGGRLPGGAAAPAVLGSAAVGAVMGTAVSNVVLCARFPIPLMTRYGSSAAIAGGIEAPSSTGWR